MIKEHRITFENVNYTKLFIDHSYQRPLTPKKIKEITDNFEPSAITALIVSRRTDGNYAIIDGQHRYKAAVKMGVTDFKCEVHHDLTISDEANLFYRINVKRGAVPMGMQFKALIEANNEDAIKLKFIVESHGFELLYLSGQKSAVDNKLTCASELQKIYNVSPDHLDLVLSILRAAWNGKKNSLKYQLIGGISKFLKTNGNQVNVVRLITLFQQKDLNDIYINARKRVQLDGNHLVYAIEREIYAMYNKKLKNKLD